MTALALDLDHAGIRLLSREGADWRVVETVPLDHADLPGAMRALRRTAEGLSPGAVETVLVIPPSQILYTQVELPDRTPLRDADIRKALGGRTPCPADELVFDWRWEGAGIRVAALDVTTLDEAEEFAVTYGFNPVRFTAFPTRAEFPEPPDFGPTQFVRHRAAEDGTLFASRRDRAEAASLPAAVAAAPHAIAAAPRAAAAARPFRRSPQAPRATARGLSRQSLVTVGTAIVTASLLVWGVTTLVRPSPDPALQDRAGGSTQVAAADPSEMEVGPAAFAPATPAPEDDPAIAAPAPPEEPPVEAEVAAVAVPADLPRDAAIALPPESAAAKAVAPALDGPARDGAVPGGPDLDSLAMTAQAALPFLPVLPEFPASQPFGFAAMTPVRERPEAVVLAALETGPEAGWTGAAPLWPGQPDAARAVPAPDALAADPVAQAAPTAPDAPDPGGDAEPYLAALDPSVALGDAAALAEPTTRTSDRFTPGGLPGTETARAEPGIVVTPGSPGRVPPLRPDRSTGTTGTGTIGTGTIGTGTIGTGTASPINPNVAAVEGRTPRTRPGGLIERRERTLLGGLTRSELAERRVRPRPVSAQQTALARIGAGSSAAALEASALPRRRPDTMPELIARAQSAAAVEAARASAPAQTLTAPAAVATAPRTPILPSTGTVAKRATDTNAINLAKLNLIGVFGSAGDRRALLRLPSGRFVRVQVGDRVDGGQVASISDNELRYVKGGRRLTLKVPSG